MLVLVTRPAEQAGATVALLEARGHQALVDPALRIVPLPWPGIGAGEAAAVLLTSANAAPLVPEPLRALPVLAVGRATATAAAAAGLSVAAVGPDDGRALARLIAQELPPQAGTLLHLAAAEARPGLAEALGAAGYAYRHVPVYRSVPGTALAAQTVAALRGGTVGAALFFSPRTAAVWRELARKAGLQGCLGGVTAVCLSRAVADELAGLPWRGLRIAEWRDQGALVRCLDGLE